MDRRYTKDVVGRWEVETGCGYSWGRQWMCVDVEVGSGWEVGLDVSG